MIFVLLKFCSAQDTLSASTSKRYSEHLSLLGPFKEGQILEQWELSERASLKPDSVRIVPALPQSSGQIWNRNPVYYQDWQVVFKVRITGTKDLGADGIAFWYTSLKQEPGPVYGSADHWKGLGVFLDTFNNDGRGPPSVILAVVNDGTLSYKHGEDGFGQSIGSCSARLRNTVEPVEVTVQYSNKILTVSTLDPKTQQAKVCFPPQPVQLPIKGHFGFTSSTGALFDNHDLISVETFHLTSFKGNEEMSIKQREGSSLLQKAQNSQLQMAQSIENLESSVRSSLELYRNQQERHHSERLQKILLLLQKTIREQKAQDDKASLKTFKSLHKQVNSFSTSLSEFRSLLWDRLLGIKKISANYSKRKKNFLNLSFVSLILIGGMD
ncbi:protein ERGIC-53-like [Zophobas morio]|uniref:protein ERGIC-53-like n=1 Tax=Zophobas morio TaxID=2755281 RepID=UPI003082A56D